MLDHFPALMCVGNPTVNSYCRMWDTGFWAPVFKDWGYQNRTTGLRISAPGRFEFRSVEWLTAGAVGEPGQRAFYIQARSSGSGASS